MINIQNKPNFLGVGAQRCGTTWLYECLLEHPEIYLPATKELGYFSTVSTENYKKPYEWYLEHFENVDTESCIGEITPSYLVDPEAGPLIKETLGNIKIIIVVRDPIDRLESAYKKGFREKAWDMSLNEFISTNTDLCVERGFYYDQITRFTDLFGKENVLVKVYEDSLTNPIDYVSDIYAFLGIKTDFIPKVISSRFNISTSAENNRVKMIVNIRDFLFKIPGMETVVRVLLRNPIGNKLFWRFLESNESTGSKKPKTKLEQIPVDALASLKEDTKKLSAFLNRDLFTIWY